MTGIINVPQGGFAKSIHVQQIINWMRGLPQFSEPVSFTGINNAAGYALTVTNTDQTNGRAFLARNWNNSVDLFSVSHAGVVVKPNASTGTIFRVRNFADNADIFSVTDAGISLAGDTVITQNATQTMTNKTESSPILLTPTMTAPILGTTTSNGYLDIRQNTAPAAPGAGFLRFYSKTGTQLVHYKINGGAEQTVVDIDSPQTVSNKTLGSGTSLGGATLSNPVIPNYADFGEVSNPGTAGPSKLRLWAGIDNNVYITRPDGSAVAFSTTALTVPTSFARALSVGLGG